MSFNRNSGSAAIRDLGSTNGTFLQGEAIQYAELYDGAKVLLGLRTVLKFVLQDSIEQNYQENIYDSSTRDGLTGCYNRKYLMERMVSHLSYSRRHKIPYTVVMLDIDHFKRVNDTYGHRTGDHVLVTISKVISKMVRAEDVFARYGGEEFAIVAQGTSYEGARVLAERVRKRVSEEIITVVGGHGEKISITISLGVVTVLPTATVDAAKIIAGADKNLYKAKENGRDNVVVSELS